MKVHSPLNYTSSSYFPLYLSDSRENGIECVIRNVSQRIIFNGGYEYIPSLLKVSGYLNARIQNISIDMPGRGLSELRPANLYLQSHLISLSYMQDFSIKDITVNIPFCWRCTTPVLFMGSFYRGNYVPGLEKEVRNITINLAEKEDTVLGTPLSFTEASNSSSNYVALQEIKRVNYIKRLALPNKDSVVRIELNAFL